ncbi:MAG: hypothetical protein COA79_07230 [Planctomycetota bacterium]|nr:MAG: hypothetical protein COA79_07230 [Planctomycetota bacterium]
MKKLTTLVLFSVINYWSFVQAENLELNISQINKNGLYSAGDKVIWTINRGRFDPTISEEHKGSSRKFYAHQSKWKKTILADKAVMPSKK